MQVETKLSDLIELTNSRYVSLPAALVYLFSSSNVYFDIENPTLLETISKSLSIFNMALACMETTSELDMNVYHLAGRTDNHQVYCSAK